ncbi:MAG: hypothetical protein GWP91_20920, partial [Rhodobacterales bacterium]|nr:hypothetical protein [Rhodobacterales bacterium]
WDYDEAYEACLEHAKGPTPQSGRAGIEAYRDYGYVTVEAASEPASRTLEFTWNDHALALWADALGHTEDASMLHAQAQGWRNIWDPQERFMRGRHEDGSFDEMEGGPNAWNDDYTEGNAWHYVWGVPWDVQGLIDVQHDGNKQAFLSRISDFWDDVREEEDDLFPDDFYWHGNEPVMHYAALGSLAGDQAISAEAARWVLRNRYNDTPLGLDGNDDAGTRSAWFLWNSIGLFPIAGTTEYAVTSPLFDRVEIDRPEGTWVLRSGGAGQGLAYVSGISTGMGPATRPVLSHEQLMSGEVVLQMTGVRAEAMR